MGRRIVAVIIALVVALIGAGAVVAYASSADKRAVADQEVRSVYIAQQSVPKGMSAQAAAAKHLIAPAQVVAKGVPAGALTDLADERSSDVALGPIPAGSVVLKSAFGKAQAAEGQVATAVPKGKVAITVNLPDPQRIAPLLKPGSHIVIYDTFNPRDENASSLTPDGAHLSDDKVGVRATRVLLPDVEVIAIGQKIVSGGQPTPSPSASGDNSTENQQGGDSALVTVALSPGDAMALVHGVQTGTLYAGLLGDGTKVDAKKGVTDKTVLGN